jgi:pSer/pThr/pTyr-binding forkhead associated (FHA) protein
VGEGAAEFFLKSCGAKGPLRLSVDGPDGSAAGTWVFHRPFVIVGRSVEADVPLDHEDVSRRHAYLQLIDGRIFCIDLESRCGTRWETGPEPWGWVEDGRPVQIGPYKIHPVGMGLERASGASGSEEAAHLPISRSYEQPGLTPVTLEFLGSQPQAPPWQVSRPLVLLGRSNACRIKLAGTEVSAIHAGLVRTPAGVWLVDLLSRSGSLINESPTRFGQLNDGDEVGIGPHRIRVRLGHRSGVPALISSPTRGASSTSMAIPDGLVGNLAPAGTEAMIGPLIREFGQMHQQMGDQFQQALLMMFRMFSGMHQDQMALIREEMARILRLSEEQQALQAELAAHLPRLVLDPRAVPDVVRPDALVIPPPGPSRGESSPPAGSAPADGVQSIGSPGRLHPTPQTGQNSDQHHDELISRIATLQKENQGRWQKLLSTVIGRGPGDGLP